MGQERITGIALAPTLNYSIGEQPAPDTYGAVTLQVDFQCCRVAGGAGAAKAQDAEKNRCLVFVRDRSVSSKTPPRNPFAASRSLKIDP